MNNKRNIIVMFLFVMLSFAIVSEVSAVSDAEADGMGFDPSEKSVDMTNHDFAGESNDDLRDHDNDFEDEFKFHNEQNSFNNTPESDGDKNIENENLYERDMGNAPQDLPFDDGRQAMDLNGTDGNMVPKDLNLSDALPQMGDAPKDLNLSDAVPPMDFNRSMDNFNFTDNAPMDLRDDNFTAVPRGEAMNDVISNLIGLNNLTPNFKKDDKNLSVNMTDPKAPADNINVTDQPGIGDKNSSAMLPADIAKNSKKVKKSKVTKKAKKAKKAKKVKKSKKAKKAKKNSQKKSKKERAKL